MSNNREISQFSSFVYVDDNTRNIGIATTATPYVGIGTTNPTTKLYVVGNTYITGILTANRIFSNLYGEFTGSSVTSNTIVGTSLSISGISTLGNVQISSGIVTATSGVVTYYGDGSKLTSIQASSIVGIATYATNSGVSTYATSAGIATNVIGGIASVTQLDVSSGIATLGVTSTTNLTAQQLNVSGLSTFSGIATHTESLFGTTASFTGVVTASSFSGNASSATYATNAGIATYATNAGIATYATNAGIATYATNAGVSTYATNAGVATALQNSRTFEITGDIVASPISFNGTGNVSLAATIQPNSVALGSDTTGDYVQSITGTSNQISVSATSGEGSTPTLSIPNQFTIPQDATVTRDLQVNRNLNVTGNITIGGTSAAIFAQELKISDPDIVLGFRTDAFGNDISNDNTANHGGVALASTEGTPLVDLFIAGIETNPSTYKKIMWFKSGTFSGLGTDAWLFNYAVGIGSTQFPTGTRLAAGNVQFTQNDLAVVRNINASGVITATSGFSGNASSATYATNAGIATYATSSGIATYATNAGIATYATNAGVSTYATNAGVSTSVIGGIGSITQLQVTGVSTFTNGPVLIGGGTSTGTAGQVLQVAGINSSAYIGGNIGIGTTNPTSKLHVIGDGRFTGVITATTFVGTLSGFASTAGIATYATNAGIATNLKGGVIGNIAYQSAADTTVFLTNGGSGTILQSNGVGNAPTWVSAAPASAITGLTVRDEGTIVGGANSISQFNFVGNIVSVASTAGIATITFLDGGVSISTNTTNQAQFIPYVTGTGSTTGLGVTTTGLVFNPSTGNLGIGTTNPTSALHVQGTTRITGITSIRDVTIDKNIVSPNATVPVAIIGVTTSGISTETNIDVVLLAKGTGATLAQVPDGTATGGNKRGIYATDWQKSRSINTYVASGNYSIVAGGQGNTASNTLATVSGGDSNIASGIRSTIAGGNGNTASSDYSFIGGGQSNIASTSTHATVCGGSANTASGQYAFVGGGRSNVASNYADVALGENATASGSNSAVLGGYLNAASGAAAVVVGGTYNTADGPYSVVIGNRGTTRNIRGYIVLAAREDTLFSSKQGAAQMALLVLARETTDATATVLASNTGTAATTNQVTLPNNSAYFFKGSCVAGVTGAGNTKAWEFKGAIKRGANAAATSIVGSVIKDVIASDAGASTWDITITADTTNGAIAVTVTGAASTTIRWVCKIETTEMTY